MIKFIITKKRKNPILRSIRDINYEILDNPEYDELKLIKDFSNIIENKFPIIRNKIPLIEFTNIYSNHLGFYHANKNTIELKSNTNNINNTVLRTLFHELGHFVYLKYLSKEALHEFTKYINRNIKQINFVKIIDLFEKLGENKLSIKYPIYFVIINSLEDTKEYDYYINEINRKDKTAPFSVDFLDWYYNRKESKVKVFTKPVSSYMPNKEEIFCEMFANYMMYDIRLLHSDNYRILKYILPELRNHD